jgi:hypothetical protein
MPPKANIGFAWFAAVWVPGPKIAVPLESASVRRVTLGRVAVGAGAFAQAVVTATVAGRVGLAAQRSPGVTVALVEVVGQALVGVAVAGELVQVGGWARSDASVLRL